MHLGQRDFMAVKLCCSQHIPAISGTSRRTACLSTRTLQKAIQDQDPECLRQDGGRCRDIVKQVRCHLLMHGETVTYSMLIR